MSLLGAALKKGDLELANNLLDQLEGRKGAINGNGEIWDNNDLVLAMERDYVVIVKRLLGIPAVLERAIVLGKELLKWAARNGHLEMVEYLLKIPAVLKEAAADQNRAFRWAAGSGHLEVVERLLEIPVVLEHVLAKNNFAFIEAAHNGHLRVVERLLQIPAVFENAAAKNNKAFRAAVRGGHLRVVERLLDIPTVLENAAAKDSEALKEAALNGDLTLLEYLLTVPVVRESLGAIPMDVLLSTLLQRGHSRIAYHLLQAYQAEVGVSANISPEILEQCTKALQKKMAHLKVYDTIEELFKDHDVGKLVLTYISLPAKNGMSLNIKLRKAIDKFLAKIDLVIAGGSPLILPKDKGITLYSELREFCKNLSALNDLDISDAFLENVEELAECLNEARPVNEENTIIELDSQTKGLLFFLKTYIETKIKELSIYAKIPEFLITGIEALSDFMAVIGKPQIEPSSKVGKSSVAQNEGCKAYKQGRGNQNKNTPEEGSATSLSKRLENAQTILEQNQTLKDFSSIPPSHTVFHPPCKTALGGSIITSIIPCAVTVVSSRG